jgi:hypothetical protein
MRVRGIVWACVAVVILVAAFVLPAVMRGRDGSDRDRACAGNLHALCNAVRMYALDSDGMLPDADQWVDHLVPRYIDNGAALKCSEDSTQARCSYGMNRALSGRKLAEIRDASRVVLLYETGHPGGNPSGGPEDVASPPRHGHGNLYVFVDGSVMKLEEPPSFEVE